MNRTKWTAAAVVATYEGAIIVANLTTAHWGPVASYYNAFFLVGWAIVSRDYLHDLWAGHRLRNMTALIVSGSALSYAASIMLASDALPPDVVGRIALASCVAFGVAESVDALTYHAMRKRDWLERSNVSNLASATPGLRLPDPRRPAIRPGPDEEADPQGRAHPREAQRPSRDRVEVRGGSVKPTRADIIAFIPRALAFVESQGGYADAELVDEKLGEKGVAALLLASARGEKVETVGGFLIRKGERRS